MSKIDAQTLRLSRPIPWLTNTLFKDTTLHRFAPVCIRDDIKQIMESSRNSRHCKRLKRNDDDGVRASGEGNITACLVAPLLEEQIPGTETCSYKGFEFTAALFLISGSDGSGSFPDVCR